MKHQNHQNTAFNMAEDDISMAVIWHFQQYFTRSQITLSKLTFFTLD